MSPAGGYLWTIARALEASEAGCMYREAIDYHQFDIMGDRGHVVYACWREDGLVYVGQRKNFDERISEHLAAGWKLRKWKVLANNLTQREAEALEPKFARRFRLAGYRVYSR